MSVPGVCLIVLDGWGLADPGPGNAIELADTPVFDDLWERCAHTTLTAKGEAVGLPEGQMGNSEVGHMNLGAGAVVMQDLTRIDEAAAASRAHSIFGRVFGRIGDSARARENLERSVELARESDTGEAIRALLNLGYHREVSEADYTGAAEAYSEGLELAERTGDDQDDAEQQPGGGGRPGPDRLHPYTVPRRAGRVPVRRL